MNILKGYKRVSFDTNIFVYFFEGNLTYAKSLKTLFEKLSKGYITGITSLITLIELLSYRDLNEEGVKETKDRFLSIQNLTLSELSQSVCEEAARIRRKYSFKTPDAIQLATALQTKAKVFITNDEELKTFKEIKVVTLKEV